MQIYLFQCVNSILTYYIIMITFALNDTNKFKCLANHDDVAGNLSVIANSFTAS